MKRKFIDTRSPRAFPVHDKTLEPGMTLRDYFAAQMMALFITNNKDTDEENAARAYDIAEMMLRERNKQPEP